MTLHTTVRPRVVCRTGTPYRMHVAVQQHRRADGGGQPVQRSEPAVRRIVAVPDTARRGMGDQHIDPPAVALPAPPGRRPQRECAAGLLPIGVLVGAVAVAQAPAEPGHPQAGRVDDAPVGVHRAVRPRRPGRHARPERQPRAGRPVSGQVGVMVAGHEHQRNVERVHQRPQILKRQITAGQDQVGAAHRARVRRDPLVDLVGHREHANRDRGQAARPAIQYTAVSRTSRPRWRSSASTR